MGTMANHGVLELHAGPAAGSEAAEGRLLGKPRRDAVAGAVRRPGSEGGRLAGGRRVNWPLRVSQGLVVRIRCSRSPAPWLHRSSCQTLIVRHCTDLLTQD